MSRLVIWVSTYLSILIYSAGVGWGEGIKGWCNRGMVGLMRWKKGSQSLIECWISQLCLLFSLASTRGHCTHCTKSLSRLWEKTVFSQRLSQLQKAFGQDKLSGRWSHSEIRNWINEQFLWSDRDVWNSWIDGQIDCLFSPSLFLTLSCFVCFYRARLKTDTCLRD